jgi:hypothetical protein
MSLDIDRIAGEDLRTTGKDDALASLLLKVNSFGSSPKEVSLLAATVSAL